MSLPAARAQSGCELCEPVGDAVAPVLVLSQPLWRLVRVTDMLEFPAYYRLIWNRHVAELSELSADERSQCIEAVAAVERVLIQALAPTKVNLAALGNLVPHLHWHVIARFDWDSHFPQPIWGSRQRHPEPPAAERLALPLVELDDRMRAALITNEESL